MVWYPLWGCSTKYKCQRSPVKNPGTVVFGGASNGMIFLGDKTFLCKYSLLCGMDQCTHSFGNYEGVHFKAPFITLSLL